MGDAASQGLFAPSSARSDPSTGDDSPCVLRRRPTDIDVGHQMGRISPGTKGAGQSPMITLSLFDDVVALIEVWDTWIANL
jgi:hypothetical protein